MSTQFATVVALRPGSRPTEKCKTTGNPDDWFPPEPTADQPDARQAYEKNARELCAGCPFIASCLEQALTDESQYGLHAHGIFGGRAPWERDNMHRAALRRASRRAVA